MTKKLILIAFIFLLLAIGVAYYFIFIQSPTDTIENPPASSFFPIDTEPGTRPAGIGSPDPIKAQFANGQPRLLKISDNPISGLTAYTEGTSTTIVRYADRTTSHITDVYPATGETIKITNTTIPGMRETLWTQSNSRLLMQFIDTDRESINTYAAAIVAPRATTSLEAMRELQVAFLPKNIETIAISPNSQRAFYIVGSAQGGQGIISNVDGTKPVEIFSSPIREWVATWPSENSIVLATRASAQTAGLAYVINMRGEMRRLLGGIAGMSILPNQDLSRIAYSNENGQLFVKDMKTGDIIATGVTTIAEKCVWSILDRTVLYCAAPATMPTADYPDAWYKGQVTFTDSIYRIETFSNRAYVVAELNTEYKQAIDGTNLILSPREDYILFTNKKDYTGWSFKINP